MNTVDMLCRTKETFLYLDGKPDRWVRTGDEVMFNENSEIFVLDRLKEIMKVRGFQGMLFSTSCSFSVQNS